MRSALPRRLQLLERAWAVGAKDWQPPPDLLAMNHDVGQSAALSAALADFEDFFYCRKCKTGNTLRSNFD